MRLSWVAIAYVPGFSGSAYVCVMCTRIRSSYLKYVCLISCVSLAADFLAPDVAPVRPTVQPTDRLSISGAK